MRSPANLPFMVRRLIVWTIQALLISIALGFAFLLRFDLYLAPKWVHILLWSIPSWIIVKTIVFRVFNLDRGWWLPASTVDVVVLFAGNVAASLTCLLIPLVIPSVAVPRSVSIMDGILCFGLCAGARVAIRLSNEGVPVFRARDLASKKRTFIYGAGQAGLMLLQEIWRNGSLPYHVVGFIDDAPQKKGLRLARTPVLGSGDDLTKLARRHRAESVLIAIPSARGSQMSRILQKCHESGVECKTVPGLSEIMLGKGLVGQMRDVAVEDLLGRLPVSLDAAQISDLLEDQVVLVTGAGGSIGSELCRQIARFRPARIVGFELAESALFEIDRQMRQCFPDVSFCTEIGNIKDRRRLDEVFGHYRPSIVFHAAAYKHVPLMEVHPFEAIENNVIGSYNVGQAAIKAQASNFVLISTDKAVNPTNVMGATKRMVELLLLGMESSTKFVAVRFGNVLGSNGSVIPIFKQQIAAGGPVTVTHEDMRRFFMTIPEACQLVLQATTVAGGGQICVLDMGEPVKIVDLARNLILLSGFAPDKDIPIEFTGMRPGEKLYEELTSDLECCKPSSHEKIMIYQRATLLEHDADSIVGELHDICQSRDAARLLMMMKELVSGYNPSQQFLKQALRKQAHSAGRNGSTPHVLVSAGKAESDGLLQSIGF